MSDRHEAEALASERAAEAAFRAAEEVWLDALSVHRAFNMLDASGDEIEEGARRAAAERAAATAFMRTPAPTLHDLPTKLLLIERETSEAALHACGVRHLIEWQALVRMDLVRLLGHGT